MYLEVSDVKKSYGEGGSYIQVLKGVSLQVKQGDMCVIQGTSGSGKSTLLNCIGGLDTIESGSIKVDGTEIAGMKADELSDYRRDYLGFIFQFYNLVQNLTVRENVEFAAQICKNPLDIDSTIKAVGLQDRMHNFPAQLSGGEQQRVAIARALAKNPKILLCDEPTGALDYQTGKAVLKLLQDTCINSNVTVIVITHNLALTPMGHKVIKVKNGKVDSITINENPTPVEQIEW